MDRSDKTPPSPWVAAAVAALAWGLSPPGALAGDPAKVVGAPACAECHEKSDELWKKTAHHAIFKTTHRSDEGKAIAKRMGIRRMKAVDGLCATCHYTVMEAASGKAKSVSGVSCESCHGAGRGWIERHSEFSGKEEQDETPEEEAARWADAEAGGMIRPGNLYALARNCYGCHVTPDEELVNVGEHPAGSDFELVAWSQGEVRHNVWYTEPNDEASAERKRQLYLAGQLAELEATLRGLAAAADPAGAYATELMRRLGAAEENLARTGLPGMADLVGAIGDAAPGDARLESVADQVAAAADGLVGDPSALSALDPLIPGSDAHKGTASP